MAYSLRFLGQRDGVVVSRVDYPVDGVGDTQTFPHKALGIRYVTDENALPSGQIEVVRLADNVAVGTFNATTGFVEGVDHDGNVAVLLQAVLLVLNGKGYEMESGGSTVAVGETSSTFDSRGLKDVVAYVTVTDIDEDVTVAVQTSVDGDTWVTGTPSVKSNENFTISFSAAPYVRLLFFSRAATGTPTLAVTYYGVKA